MIRTATRVRAWALLRPGFPAVRSIRGYSDEAAADSDAKPVSNDHKKTKFKKHHHQQHDKKRFGSERGEGDKDEDVKGRKLAPIPKAAFKSQKSGENGPDDFFLHNHNDSSGPLASRKDGHKSQGKSQGKSSGNSHHKDGSKEDAGAHKSSDRSDKAEKSSNDVEARFWPAVKFEHDPVQDCRPPRVQSSPMDKLLKELKLPQTKPYTDLVKAKRKEHRKKSKKAAAVSAAATETDAVKEKPEKDTEAEVQDKTITYKPWQFVAGSISDFDVTLTPVNQKGDKPDVLPPTMKHETAEALFKNNTVQTVRDSRTGVYNFPQYVENIVSTDEIDMQLISGFTPPSKDTVLQELARETGSKYFGSTSTLTPVLQQFHNLLSNFRPASLRSTSKWVAELTSKPTKVYQSPHVAEITRRGDTYALGVDKTGDSESLLSKLGHSLEAFLTHTPEEYECLKKNPNMALVSEEQIREVRGRVDNTYAYSRVAKFLTRSQLDCYDSRLPGTGTFDLKTRAVAGTRYDQVAAEMHHGTDYYVDRPFGHHESFERELVDMSRTVALKYSLQARIGRMDGIYVAYHNMKRFFGFQYFPLATLDRLNHTASMEKAENLLQDPSVWSAALLEDHKLDVNRGTFELTRGSNAFAAIVEDEVEKRASAIADKEFRLSMELISRVMDVLVKPMTADDFDEHHQRAVFYADPHQAGRMLVCVGSHDKDEVAFTGAMSSKYHNSLLRTEMASRDASDSEASFEYESWPWKAENVELPENQDSEIAKMGLAELEKMNGRYSAQEFITAVEDMWRKSLRKLSVYELHVKNFVNQKNIPLSAKSDIHPSPSAETEWVVQYRLAQLSGHPKTLEDLYIEMIRRKLMITTFKKNDLNDMEEADVNEFGRFQQHYNNRGKEKLARIDDMAAKLDNPVSQGNTKRHWMSYSDGKEKEIKTEGYLTVEDLKDIKVTK